MRRVMTFRCTFCRASVSAGCNLCLSCAIALGYEEAPRPKVVRNACACRCGTEMVLLDAAGGAWLCPRCEATTVAQLSEPPEPPCCGSCDALLPEDGRCRNPACGYDPEYVTEVDDDLRLNDEEGL